MQNAGAKVWLLNMACATNPGGGVMSGCNAQEERLCRYSNLLPQLEKAQQDGLYPLLRPKLGFARVLAHREVVFFKRASDYAILPEETWFRVGVLTAAAEKVRGPFRQVGPNAERFIGHLLDVAHNQDCTHLVLSAWGCGAFGQDAEGVAGCFHSALSRINQSNFPAVTFAIKDDHNSQPPGNLHAFHTVLGT